MSLMDMDAVGVEEAIEPIAVVGGEEYELRIVNVKSGTDKNGHDYYMPILEIANEIAAKEFSYFIGCMGSDMTDKEKNNVRWKISQFCQCFGLSTTGEVDPESEWPGNTGFAILGQSESDEYGEQNFIKKLVVPSE